MLNSSERFSSRVSDYVRYRPDYPQAAIEVLARDVGLGVGVTVADLGAGTGILTLPLAQTGAEVIAIDPNKHMLAAAEELLRRQENVRVAVGTAEATGLDDSYVDAVTAGQAFHWFDHQLAREEFARILKPGGKVALIWNAKQFDAPGFLADYEKMLEAHVPEFAEVRHEKSGEDAIVKFYGGRPALHTFPHEQRFDWEGVLGRVMSSSYSPKPGDPSHEVLVAGLRELFAQHERQGRVVWPYTTTLYIGQLR